MKKIWGIVLALILCNTFSLVVADYNQRECSIKKATHYFTSQSSISALDCNTDFNFDENQSNSATVIGRVSNIEVNSASSISSSNGKTADYNISHRQIVNISDSAILHEITPLSFTRAIDLYIYAMRHIII